MRIYLYRGLWHRAASESQTTICGIDVSAEFCDLSDLGAMPDLMSCPACKSEIVYSRTSDGHISIKSPYGDCESICGGSVHCHQGVTCTVCRDILATHSWYPLSSAGSGKYAFLTYYALFCSRTPSRKNESGNVSRFAPKIALGGCWAQSEGPRSDLVRYSRSMTDIYNEDLAAVREKLG